MSAAIEAMLPMLKRRLTESPKEIGLLKRIGEIYRHQGKLSDADEIYRQLKNIDGNDQYVALANHQLSSFNSQHWLSDRFWPAPFIHQEQVLSQTEYTEILTWCHSKEAEFEPAKIFQNNTQKVDLTFRNQSIYECSSQETIWVCNKFKALINTSIEALGLHSKKYTIVGADISLTQNGGFGKTHSDGTVNKTQSPIQEFSFLYYFTTKPTKFEGGDLVLHDTNFKSNSFKTLPTKIPFSNNSFVFFPRYFFHSINKVMAPNPLAWNEGRFAIFININIKQCQ